MLEACAAGLDFACCLSYQAAPPVVFGNAGAAADLRTLASSVSDAKFADLQAHKAFIKRKALTAYTQPTATKEARLQAAQQIALKGGVPLQAVFDPPTPGGVGYGAIFTDSFRALWGTGTAIIFTIVCPYRPGGNVDTWLYPSQWLGPLLSSITTTMAVTMRGSERST
jgi:hypothetical protein